MAVPKKKVSKSRRNSRKDTWNKKVLKNLAIAIAFAKASKGVKTFGNFLVE